ncbi:hypothetical protein GJAV_G00222250 [Gymnothorax javanicus]|nr:hypothetical protein GJAV_G00222250 [Gymnothorax javanicus]
MDGVSLMSENWGRREEEEVLAELGELKRGSAVVNARRVAPLNLLHDETLGPDQQGPALHPALSSLETSTSPSNEETGLLSLPWEMVARIASHLPAQCVIRVLPKVCRALGSLGEDSISWQLRARRLIGPGASFPMGPRESFDWPTACLEMEDLISCWAGLGQSQGQDQGAGIEREGVAAEVGGPEAGGQRLEGGEEVMEGGGQLGDRGGLDGGGAEVGGEERQNEPMAEEDVGERDRGEGLEERGGLVEEGAMVRVVAEGEMAGEEEGDLSTLPGPAEALERVSLPSGHIAEVNTVLLVGGEGALLASGSRDRNVNLWDLRGESRGTLVRTLGAQGLFSTHLGWVWCLAARGPLLCSGSFDSTVRLWDLGSGGAERGRIQGRAAVHCLSCQSDVLLAGSADRKVSIYDIRAADPLVKSLRLHRNAVLCLSADEQYILSGSKDRTLSVFDRRAGKQLQRLSLNSYLFSMCYSGREIWAGDNQGLIHSFALRDGLFQPVSQFDVGHRSLVTGIHYSPGALYTCSSDRSIKVHLPSVPPKTLCSLQYQSTVNGLSVEGGVLAVASGEESVEVWRPQR